MRNTYLKDKFVDSNWNRSNHDAIEDLVVLFILCRTHIDNLPFQIYEAIVVTISI